MKSYGEKVEYEYGNSLDFEFINGKLTKIKADDFSDAKTKAGIGLGASMDMVKKPMANRISSTKKILFIMPKGCRASG